MSWFASQYEAEPCDKWCPFGACSSCAFRGSNSTVPQTNTTPDAEQETAGNGKVGDSNTAPAGNRGLTAKTVRSPDGCL